MCPFGGLYIQVPLYINYSNYSVSLWWSLYTGSTVHQLLQCVLRVVFIYRFHCTLTTVTTVSPFGGLHIIQVPLHVHQLLQCVLRVVFIYRLHCILTTIEYLLHGWSSQHYTGSMIIEVLRCVAEWSLWTDCISQELKCLY